ncbi:MAG: hypothetical protein JJ902_04015 [Roseibium sp.]|nr:hypothetical protein [Roseibium sp.]
MIDKQRIHQIALDYAKEQGCDRAEIQAKPQAFGDKTFFEYVLRTSMTVKDTEIGVDVKLPSQIKEQELMDKFLVPAFQALKDRATLAAAA